MITAEALGSIPLFYIDLYYDPLRSFYILLYDDPLRPSLFLSRYHFKWRRERPHFANTKRS